MRKLYWRDKLVIIDVVRTNEVSVYEMTVQDYGHVTFTISNVYSDDYLNDDFIKMILEKKIKL
jgi:hypothetical protein